jgi:hypothetical protein
MKPQDDVSPEERLRIENQLHTRLVAARDAYKQAKAEAEALRNLRADLGLNHPDGRTAALN